MRISPTHNIHLANQRLIAACLRDNHDRLPLESYTAYPYNRVKADY